MLLAAHKGAESCQGAGSVSAHNAIVPVRLEFQLFSFLWEFSGVACGVMQASTVSCR